MNTKIIARFAGFESYFYAISILMIMIYGDISAYLDMWNHPPGTSALGYEWSKLHLHYFTLVVFLLGPFIALAQMAFLWQLIFRKRVAAWIADDQLIFFNYGSSIPMAGSLFTRVPLENIAHISVLPAKPLRCSTVVLHLKNGNLKYIPALLLTENAESLMPRLSAALT